MTALVARTTVAELIRRRGALVLVTLMPLLFFVVRIDEYWTAVRLLAMGLGWGVATLALFTHVSARSLDRRLVVAGAPPLSVYAGRQLAVLGLGWALALASFGLVVATISDDLERLAPVLLILLITVTIAVPLGALVAALVPRDLEGALLLLGIMAVQILVDPSDGWTRALPMWSARELATYAVEPVGTDYLMRGSVHGVIALALLVTASLTVSRRRLRTRAVPLVTP